MKYGKMKDFKIHYANGDIAMIRAKDPLRAAILAAADRIRIKKDDYHIAGVEHNGELVSGGLMFTEIP
jgi:hypothetical protein